jgi:exonuclease III
VTVNVGTLRGRASEVVETISRRNIDICCLQEVRWRGAGTRLITGKDTQYKLFWVGNKEGSSGVGVLLAEKWIDKVIHLNRVNDRLMLIKILIGKQVLTVVSAYAPQQALSDEAKGSFYADLVLHTSKINDKEILILGGDLNGHVGKTTSGYEDVHGGFGYGVRNAEGERILEFGLALDMVVCNTLFQKRSSRLITFSSGGSNTHFDYIIISN